MKLEHVPTTGAVTAVEDWEGDNAYAYFPIMWAPKSDGHSGPPVTDPGLIYIMLPLGEDEAQDPMFAVSLSGLVQDYVGSIELGEGGPFDASEVPNIQALSRELRRLADDLDARAAKST